MIHRDTPTKSLSQASPLALLATNHSNFPLHIENFLRLTYSQNLTNYEKKSNAFPAYNLSIMFSAAFNNEALLLLKYFLVLAFVLLHWWLHPESLAGSFLNLISQHWSSCGMPSPRPPSSPPSTLFPKVTTSIPIALNPIYMLTTPMFVFSQKLSSDLQTHIHIRCLLGI